MDITTQIHQLLQPSLEDMGYDVVLIKLADGAGRKTLTVMAERRDGVQMSFDDCGEISHVASALLEVDDPISGAYNLEVCSPGIDRPLTRIKDYEKYAGHEIKLETKLPVDGRKRYKGKLEGIHSNKVNMQVDGKPVTIAYENIHSAKLLMTDALLAEHMKKQETLQIN